MLVKVGSFGEKMTAYSIIRNKLETKCIHMALHFFSTAYVSKKKQKPFRKKTRCAANKWHKPLKYIANKLWIPLPHIKLNGTDYSTTKMQMNYGMHFTDAGHKNYLCLRYESIGIT